MIAPLITSELLATEAPTVVFAIGSTDTRIDIENTLKTIKSYETIARMRKAPVIMSYAQNSVTMPRNKVDDMIVSDIMSLCVLFSQENHELDSRDLFNWLRYDRVTTFSIQCAALTIIDNGETDISDIGNVISVATVAKTGESTALKQIPEYQCVGYLPEDTSDTISNRTPIHFITSDGIITEVVNHLNKILKDLEAAQKARINKATIITDKDRPEDNGLVL